jgi:hypothetical protein
MSIRLRLIIWIDGVCLIREIAQRLFMREKLKRDISVEKRGIVPRKQRLLCVKIEAEYFR